MWSKMYKGEFLEVRQTTGVFTGTTMLLHMVMSRCWITSQDQRYYENGLLQMEGKDLICTKVGE